MSQITRCPACQTTFRVVPDQLKIAQGWVRCGQCGEVFDASARPVPELADAPSPRVPDHAPAVQPTPEPPAGSEAPTPDGALIADETSADRPGTAESPPVAAAPAAAPFGETLPVAAPLEHPASDTPLPPPAEADFASEVSFVRDAIREEFWTKPLVRAVLGMLIVLLLAALALQWIVQRKDALAAIHPRLRPFLQALCDPLGCDIRPLRRIAALAFDSTSFVKTGPDTYRLGFVLKNNDMAALEVPAVEVTLTDSREQALVRRVLTPAQFGANAATLGAHLELTGAVFLRVAGGNSHAPAPSQAAGPLSVAGYRLLAFYP